MEIFKVDLYSYFEVKRPSDKTDTGILTCYIPSISKEINENRKSPAMLVLPGGGYAYCSDREAEPVALAYVSYGFNAFVLNYSVAPVKFPYSLVEAIMAMNYIRLNADKLHVDVNMVAAVGFSAGGHLCGMLGSYYNSKEAEKIFVSKVSARPDAIILSYPVITAFNEKSHIYSFIALCGDDDELKNRLQVNNLVTENSSPAFIWATYTDGVVPVKNSLVIASAYEEKGVPFSLHIFGKGQHGLSKADKTVYGASMQSAIEQASVSVSEWIRLSVEWLAEQNVCIKD